MLFCETNRTPALRGEDAEQIGPEILYLRGKAVDKKDRDMIQ